MNTGRTQPARAVGAWLLVCGLLLQGCGAADDDAIEWRQWRSHYGAAEVSAAATVGMPSRVAGTPEAVATVTAEEEAGEDEEVRVDPFDPRNLLRLLRDAEGVPMLPQTLVDAQLRRERELLESFPLEALTLVGTLARGELMVGLVRADGAVHLVRQGQYLGPNFGRVVRIEPAVIELREIVQDGVGDWVEQTRELTLQEGG